jgi:enoyl-CoA hydratase/carnithine racemase
MTESQVLFDRIPTGAGKAVGVATLNQEKTLNSLSLAMIDLLADKLAEWRTDNDVAVVLIQGAGDRAFCAGGDIKDLYRSMCEHPGGPNPYAEAFFEREYRLDYVIHTFPKPVLAWGHGIVMGGGLGIAAACSHRVGTERSRFALPEITIGLFPDAGATWLLAHMPSHLAYFIAWTGCQLNAIDGRRVGFVDHLVPSSAREAVIAAMQQASWQGDAAQDAARLSDILGRFVAADDEFPTSVLDVHDDTIRRMVNASFRTPAPVAEFARQLGESEGLDPWFEKASTTLNAGCPTTAHLIAEQIRRSRGLTLKQTFMMELAMAIQCSRHPDFTEGVRALLIDRDNRPDWAYEGLAEVPAAWVEEHFVLPVGGEQPLADLAEPGVTTWRK